MELPVRFISTIVRDQNDNREAAPHSPVVIAATGYGGNDIDVIEFPAWRQ